ncbi:MAG: energy transducer TonB [Porphyromonadaceae bacterium]|nr:energy transducer TonB [Porphyromonadaceae bacterium]
MAKDINLTSEKWIDIIFEGRNKNYGAYTLRKNSPKRHTFAFLVVLLGAAIVVAASITLSQIKKAREARETMTQVSELSNISLDKPEVPEEMIEKKFEAPPPVELKSTIHFTVPEIKKDEEVPADAEIKTQDEVVQSNVQISIADVKGTNEETGVDIATLQEHKVIVQEEVKEEKVFEIVEQPPSFPGGESAMYEWLSKNINYPVIAQENNIQGRVTCQFVVGRNGEIEDVRVVRGVDPSLDREAIRVIKAMPKWIPGRQGGNAVKVRYTLPVQFRLQ